MLVRVGERFGGRFCLGDQGHDSGGEGVELLLGAFDDQPCTAATGEQEPVLGGDGFVVAGELLPLAVQGDRGVCGGGPSR